MLTPSFPPVLDRADGLRRARGDEKLYKELIEIFLGDLSRMLNQIDEAITQQSASGLRLAAHTLRGAASQIGGCALAQSASVLEQIGKTNLLDGAEDPCRLLHEEALTLVRCLRAELDRPTSL